MNSSEPLPKTSTEVQACSDGLIVPHSGALCREPDVRIAVEGPGGIVAAPIELIVRALRAAGATVMVTDEHPEPKLGSSVNLEGCRIELTAKHLLWGG